jgi:hypothetical protein
MGGVTSLLLVALSMSAACATPTPTPTPMTPQVPAARPRPQIVSGPAATEPRAPQCTPEAALFGPITAAAGWGRAQVACRIGPSPKLELERALRGDETLRSCLVWLGVTWLDGRVRLSGTGAVLEVVVDELRPMEVDVRPCLARVTRYRFAPAGCELEARLHFAQY